MSNTSTTNIKRKPMLEKIAITFLNNIANHYGDDLENDGDHKFITDPIYGEFKVYKDGKKVKAHQIFHKASPSESSSD